MKSIKKDYIIFSIIVSIVICICYGLYSYVNNYQYLETIEPMKKKAEENQLNVHYIDVAQSECILITQGNEAMILDAGCNDSERHIEEYLQSMDISRLKYVIGTRLDEEHIGALDYIVRNFDVDNVVCPRNKSETKAFLEFTNQCNDKGLVVTVPEVEYRFTLGDAQGCIFIENSEEINTDYDYSMIIKITYGNNSFLFEGSGQYSLQNKLLSNNTDLEADVIKFRYKETENNNNNEFLEAVNPKFAVITGMNNNPNPFIQFNFKDIKTFKTDINGTIVAASDGDYLSFSVEKIDWNSWLDRGEGNSIPFDDNAPNNIKEPPKGKPDMQRHESPMDDEAIPKPPKDEIDNGRRNPPHSDYMDKREAPNDFREDDENSRPAPPPQGPPEAK